MSNNKPISVIVAWGESNARDLSELTDLPENWKEIDNINEYSFETVEEMEAFCLGVNEYEGWMDATFYVKADSTKTIHDISVSSACVGLHIGDTYDIQSLGGLMACYDLSTEIANAFIARYPSNFDWEAHMEAGGDCWDIELFGFSDQFIEKFRDAKKK